MNAYLSMLNGRPNEVFWTPGQAQAACDELERQYELVDAEVTVVDIPVIGPQMLKDLASLFVFTWQGVEADVAKTALEHGWWEEPRSFGDVIALIHSELSEALEADRHGNPPGEHIPEFSGIEEELADAVIRIMDFAGTKGHRVVQAILAKAAYNKSRPYKHGKLY
jgi:NTP pyrophosphatase (non-canonical NTP hydrolase)